MKIDLTVPIQRETLEDFLTNTEKDTLIQKFGHFGTHFDVMDKEFPLEYCELKGKIFDVRNISKKEIDISDVPMEQIEKNDFIIIHTGFLEEYGYGSKEYFKQDLELSDDLLRALVEKRICILGIDMAGVKIGKEHAKADQFLADQGIFVVENLDHLSILEKNAGTGFVVHTYPLALNGVTGLTSRIIAEI